LNSARVVSGRRDTTSCVACVCESAVGKGARSNEGHSVC
jgi:hypothetical protein